MAQDPISPERMREYSGDGPRDVSITFIIAETIAVRLRFVSLRLSFIITYAVADILAGAFVCWPIAYLWDKSIAGGHCINIPAFYRWGTLPNILIDLQMLILPQPVVWSLQIPKQVKFGLAATLLTGSIGMVTSIVRCVAFFTNDPLIEGTWKSVIYLQWSIIETGVYLIAACLPCYRPLVKLAMGQRRTAVGSGYKSPGSAVSGRKDAPRCPIGIGIASSRVTRR
ncbi:uncharacterized protein KD926_007438 [Aspergillus affinis]|uniref:uncharacterized protein n=1 Tax=Aspergillus affinis TaxID=1070780 RepID=UPI0022FE567F|nr:uncharacterized protein KD926_007438 [Aspergillus affinis]KAI9041022.1 hypothetical protein KD926_007438 [Aspergillus affinis]